ncbi:WXG100 family type VII secretion target [Mycolicibacterium frederiksbergense]|uniref:Secretion protein n=1 Tax=Mycolicibacterium frederiksbergense TaxID=117567 RepID=A0A6H0S0C7_9MYCO|nr:WXG100 family type VII secretion target [Mycolicibacterium frederiksbergense]QIV79929.1 hypothetical protein EXE63_02680 [Mycolicibacterium frederiksbergense]
MTGPIHGDIEAIGRDAGSLQEISDQQAAIMKSLGSTLEGLAPALRGGAGTAMQNVGEQLQHQGQQFATAFADHSHKMGNNAQILSSADEHGSAMISGVGNLIV